MKQIVIGTAGHIDHGKTALIRALTGIDCDRLKEEKERGITIELGFAYYRFGDDILVGIVDVPGHERFVRHMVAGAWGIDMVLFVVAADESVMPQTREHLDICDLLGITRGIVAITKTDLADADMVELVKEEVADLVKGRFLEGAPVIPVSSVTGENMDLLREEIRRMAAETHERSREGIFRLPVDRVFTIRGFGTIVTGTCISGRIGVGDEIEIYPTGKRARVRNIQAYHEDVKEAGAGQRVALNLQGLEKSDIERGTIIGRPDTLILTNRIDATLRYLKLPFKPIRNTSILRFHIATTQAEAKLILLDRNAVEPGEEVFCQYTFEEPIVVLPGDRYILRGSYAIQTLGGGTIVDILPRRHQRKSDVLARTFETLSRGSVREKAEYHVIKGGYEGLRTERLAALLGLDDRAVEPVVAQLTSAGVVKAVGRTVVHAERFATYRKMLVDLVTDFVARNPLKAGISKEELRSRLPKVEQQLFQAALDDAITGAGIETDKDKVTLKSAAQKSDGAVEELRRKVVEKLRAYGLTPPTFQDLAGELGMQSNHLKDLLEKLVRDGRITRVKGDMYFDGTVIEQLKQKVVAFLKEKGEMQPADFRNLTGLSRKYMIPLLEYFDEIRLTIRTGDKRVLRS